MRGSAPVVSVVLPRYRETGPEIHRTLFRLEQELRDVDHEVIVANDGGSVGDFERLRDAFPEVIFLHSEHNVGKGRIIGNAMPYCSGRYIFYSDVDLPVSLGRISDFIDLMSSKNIDIVVGRRIKEYGRSAGFYREITSSAFRKLFHLIVRSRIQDSQCPFKIFRRDTAVQIFSKIVTRRYAFDAEVIHVAELLGKNIAQVDIRWCDTRAQWSGGRALRIFLTMIADLVRIRFYWKIHRGLLLHEATLARQRPVVPSEEGANRNIGGC